MRRRRLEQLLARADSPGTALRTIYDAYNDEEVVLSKEEVRLIQRIRSGRFPHVEARPALGNYTCRHALMHFVLMTHCSSSIIAPLCSMPGYPSSIESVCVARYRGGGALHVTACNIVSCQHSSYPAAFCREAARPITGCARR